MGARRAILAVVLAGALVTYGGVSLFVAFFVLAPMAQALFRAADIPRRLMPAAIALGTSTFTMTAFPGTPAIQNAIPMPFFGTTPFAAPGLGIVASAIMLGFGLWWLTVAKPLRGEQVRAMAVAPILPPSAVADDPIIRELATIAREFDPAEINHGRHGDAAVPIGVAVLPLAVVVSVNLLMSLVILPRLDFSFLAEARWGATSLSAVAGVWSVAVALAAAILTLVLANRAAVTDVAREHGCRCQRLCLAGVQRCQPRWLRRRRRDAARVCDGARLGAFDRGRAIGLAGDRN